MKVCIYGAGAIGGYLGAMLSAAGEQVSLVARGPHLDAIRRNGLELIINGESKVSHPTSTDDPAVLGIQDVVFITLKAPSVSGIVEQLLPLLGRDTVVVSAVNGIPWWYFYGLSGQWEDRRLKSIDPDDRQWRVIKPERVLGCVVYPACEVSKPGVITHINGNRFTLGEPSGEKSERAMLVSRMLINSGLKAPVRTDIRSDIWIKLWGNMCFNPISALTHATLDTIATDPGTRAIAKDMMLEAQAIGEKLGARFSIDVEKRIDGAAAVGSHKTSMLQDLERNRPLELDALTAVIQELGDIVNIPTPTIDTVLSLILQRARTAGLYEQ